MLPRPRVPVPCRRIPRRRRRIEEVATRRLVEKSADTSSNSGTDVGASTDPNGDVLLEFDGSQRRLSREAACALRDDLADALTRRREFLYTAGEHREDGSYVVQRRAADSAGHSKVFERFTALERLYGRLPREFTAEEVGRTGLTGGRRHMLVRHFAEHPAFDCELVSRQPLTIRKAERDAVESERVDAKSTDADPAEGDSAGTDPTGARPVTSHTPEEVDVSGD